MGAGSFYAYYLYEDLVTKPFLSNGENNLPYLMYTVTQSNFSIALQRAGNWLLIFTY
jgi:hypothetical protein